MRLRTARLRDEENALPRSLWFIRIFHLRFSLRSLRLCGCFFISAQILRTFPLQMIWQLVAYK